LSDLFGLRSLAPLAPNAATQACHPLDQSMLRLTVMTTQLAIKRSTQPATNSTP